MSRFGLWRWIVVACAAAAAGGCQGAGDAVGGFGAAGPQEAVVTVTRSLARTDRRGFLECLIGTADEMAASRAFVDFLAASQEFKRAMVAAYGLRGWAEFQDPDGARLETEIHHDPNALAAMRCEVAGDTAVCVLPDDAQRLHLVRRQGRWYVRARDVVHTEDSPAESARLWRRLAEVVRRTKARIGRRGVTAESLDQEMGRAFLHIMGSR
jgi:hypothetical protein